MRVCGQGVVGQVYSEGCYLFFMYGVWWNVMWVVYCL